MPHRSAQNPLHGLTLEAILTELVERCGWEEMGRAVDIRCFKFDPSIKSSLQFLRRTPWARTKVEELYLNLPARSPETVSTPVSAPIPFLKPNHPTVNNPLPGALDNLVPDVRLPVRRAPGPADLLLGRADAESARKTEAARLRAVSSYDRAALRSHTLNRSHAQFKTDNRSKV